MSFTPEMITEKKAAIAFLQSIVDAGYLIDPSVSFATYVDYDTHSPCFTADEAAQLDAVMDRCFAVCDPYTVANGILEKYLGVETE